MRKPTLPTDSAKLAKIRRRSAETRAKKWGKQEFRRRMREWGKLGGRPKGSGKKAHAQRKEGNQ